MHAIDIRAHIGADPRTVWTLLDDSMSWPSWTQIDTCAVVTPPGSDGLGEVRVFRNGRHVVREQIVERRRASRLSYTLLAGLPLRDYRAEIDLVRGSDGDTDVRWHTVFRSRVFGLGWLYERALRKATQSFVDGLTDYALREHGVASDTA